MAGEGRDEFIHGQSKQSLLGMASHQHRCRIHRNHVGTLSDLGEIIGELELEPIFIAAAEGFGEANGHLGGNRGAAIHQIYSAPGG